MEIIKLKNFLDLCKNNKKISMINLKDRIEITITHKIKVDKCLAEEIMELNNKYGILTLASCCGHGKEQGFIAVHDDTFKLYEEMLEGDESKSGDNIMKMLKLGYEKIEPYSYLARNASLKTPPMKEHRKKIPCFKPKSICKCKK